MHPHPAQVSYVFSQAWPNTFSSAIQRGPSHILVLWSVSLWIAFLAFQIMIPYLDFFFFFFFLLKIYIYETVDLYMLLPVIFECIQYSALIKPDWCFYLWTQDVFTCTMAHTLFFFVHIFVSTYLTLDDIFALGFTHV